jgi:hypothetical protein
MSTFTMHPIIVGIVLLLFAQLAAFAVWLIRVHASIKVLGTTVWDIKTNCLSEIKETAKNNHRESIDAIGKLQQAFIDHLADH